MEMAKPTSLEIRNYKCFSSLRLETVGDVNLIAGKNNVGKTTLLEAVALVASGGNPTELFRILDRRERPSSEAALVQCMMDQFPALPCVLGFDEFGLDGIKIDLPANWPKDNLKGLWSEFRRDSHSKLIPSFAIHCMTGAFAFDLTLETRQAAYAGVFDTDPRVAGTMRTYRSNFELRSNPNLIRRLWDETEARPSEEILIQAMRIIEPKIQRITLPSIPETPTPRLRLGDSSELAPITRFGDGLTRLFEIGLSLVNAKGGFLLLDEIEDGLHHSVFPKLWEFLLRSSKDLDVTIFATTHSYDAAVSFSRSALDDKNSLGVLTRLDQRKSGIVPVQFTEREAFLATEEGLEVR